jgi:hypothetical protein
MSKHKSEDYKISAVKYYLNNDVRDLINLGIEIKALVEIVHRPNFEDEQSYRDSASSSYRGDPKLSVKADILDNKIIRRLNKNI